MFRDLPRYSDTRPSSFWSAEVPNHWLQQPGLAVIVENRRKNVGLVVSQVLSLSHGRVVVKPVEKQRGLVPESYEGYQILNPGDIVVRPTDLQNDQTSIRVGYVMDRGVITSAYIGLRPTGDWIDSYAYQYLTVVDSSKRIYGMGRGLRQQLAWADLKRVPCLVPPADEQAAIVKYLAHANARINKAIIAKRRLIALLEEQKRAAARESLGKDNWPVWPLGRLGRMGNGSTPSRSIPSYWGGDIPWLNSSVVNRVSVVSADEFVTDEALAMCHLPLVPAGSVLVGITGQGKTRGMSTVLRVPATINQHIVFITPNERRASADFLNLTLSIGYDELRRISDGSGSTKGALTISDLKAFRIPLPPLDVQQRVLAAVRANSTESNLAISKTQREITLLQEFRTRLVADVVTGQVDVRAIAATLPDAPDVIDRVADSEEDPDEVAEDDDE